VTADTRRTRTATIERVPAATRTAVSPARRVAAAVLARVSEQDAYADRALDGEAVRAGLDPRERAFATALVYGTVQRRRTLDHLIAVLAGRPPERLDPPVRDALALGLLQLLWLDGVAPHAAVDQSVELAKPASAGGARLVNAVLRRAVREGRALVDALGDETPEAAALKHSVPDWIARLWWDALGAEETRALLARVNEPAETALRVNALVAEPGAVAAELAARGVAVRGAAATAGGSAGPQPARGATAGRSAGPQPARGATAGGSAGPQPARGATAGGSAGAQPARGATAGPLAAIAGPLDALPEALVVDGPFDARADPLWGAGALVAQSRAAQMAARLLAPEPGMRVLDLCAAPGGKTTHLAALMGGEGEVVAVERHPGRADALRRTCERLRAQRCVRVETADAARLPADGSFDAVLVDPPCSGLGTLQGRPDRRWRASAEAIEPLAALQAEILAAGAAALRPGGALLYATCTISPRENEQVVETFLAAHTDFMRERTLQLLPHRDGSDGFFYALLRRAVGAR
jgi:16S rRNA (cytosine967-C5)-methyltransferase